MANFPEPMTFLQGHSPHFDTNGIDCEIDTFFTRGPIDDITLRRRIASLNEAFSVYISRYPLGLWADGLVVTHEMAALTEQYLRISDIASSFRRLVSLSLKFMPLHAATPFANASSWLEVLPRLHPDFRKANPASLLEMLCRDDSQRLRFIFSLFLPRRYGGSFHRYAVQEAFIKRWITENSRSRDTILCLDAACGTGEGTYGLASLITDSGVPFLVRGETIEPIELFSAAHAFMPHDLARQEQFRSVVAPLPASSISFALWDVIDRSLDPLKYHIVMCNGLLGGPMLSDPHRVRRATENLVARMERGALFVAADHFHDGWKKGISRVGLQSMLQEEGLEILDVDEGVAAVRSE